MGSCKALVDAGQLFEFLAFFYRFDFQCPDIQKKLPVTVFAFHLFFVCYFIYRHTNL